MSQLSDFGYLRIWQVLQLFPVGKSTWWAGVKDGRFPKPVKLGPRTTAWRTSDIQEFLEARGQQPTAQQEFRA